MDTIAPGTVLLLAPESDLRRSLTFMLSAEGFTVETGARWPHGREPGQVQAVIIDDAIIDKDFRRDEALQALGSKVVVLNGRSKPYAGLPAATVIHKPLLDHVVLNTIKGFST